MLKKDLKRNRVFVDWILLAQDRDQWRAFVNTVPYKAWNFLTRRTTISFSTGTAINGVSFIDKERG
jgi:hypothetical protein